MSGDQPYRAPIQGTSKPVWHLRGIQEDVVEPLPSGSVAMDPTGPSTSSSGTASTGPSRGGSMDMDRMGRPKRKRINPEQLARLLELFAHTDTPSYEMRESVGAELGMTNREVQVWFQNRRAKERSNRQRTGSTQPSQRSAVPLPSRGDRSPETRLVTTSPLQTFAVTALPTDFATGRRRSMSTSAVQYSADSLRAIDSREGPYKAPRPPSAEQNIGPIRPRMGRYHSHNPNSSYRLAPLQRNTAWPPREVARQTSGFPAAIDQSVRPRQFGSLPSPPTALSPPFTAGALSTAPPTLQHSSFPPSSGPVQPEQRATRLPPIKLILDIADQAASPYPVSPYVPGSVGPRSASPLNSPFGRLDIQTPPFGYPQYEAVQTPSPSYFDLASGPAAAAQSPEAPLSDTSTYTFGKTFPPRQSPPSH